MPVVVALSIAAALLFAVAATCQAKAAGRAQRTLDRAGRGRGLSGALALVRRLLTDRLWLAGWGANLAGFATQAGALHAGSVAVVQPLMVTQLAFTLPLAALTSRYRPTWRDGIGVACVTAGLAVLLSVRGAIPPGGRADRGRLLFAGALVVGVAVVLASGRASRRHGLRAAVLGVAAGLMFALSAVLTKLTTVDLFDRGVGATASDWPGYALAFSTTGGLLLEQEAFAAGPLPTAMTGMTIANPVTSYILAVVAFGVPLPASAGSVAAALCGAAALFTGIRVLAGSRSLELTGQRADRTKVTREEPSNGTVDAGTQRRPAPPPATPETT